MGAAERDTGDCGGRDEAAMCLEDARHGERGRRGTMAAGTKRSSATDGTTTKPSKPSSANALFTSKIGTNTANKGRR